MTRTSMLALLGFAASLGGMAAGYFLGPCLSSIPVKFAVIFMGLVVAVAAVGYGEPARSTVQEKVRLVMAAFAASLSGALVGRALTQSSMPLFAELVIILAVVVVILFIGWGIAHTEKGRRKGDSRQR